MHRLVQKFVLPASLALFAGGLVADAAPVTLYDSQGFEPTAAGGGFSTGNLYNQPPQGNNYWFADNTSATGVPANVRSSNGLPTDQYGNGAQTQVVELARATTSTDTRWAPATFAAGSPYRPSASGMTTVNIDWDMDIVSGSNDLFGVELNNSSGTGGRIAYVAVDSSGHVNDDVAGAFTPTGATAPAGWNHYELSANFAAQTYGVYLDGTLVGSGVFEDPANQFTDASLVSYGALAAYNPGGSGTAEYDNYIITSVPEPTGEGAVLAGASLLLLRRRRGADTQV